MLETGYSVFAEEIESLNFENLYENNEDDKMLNQRMYLNEQKCQKNDSLNLNSSRYLESTLIPSLDRSIEL